MQNLNQLAVMYIYRSSTTCPALSSYLAGHVGHVQDHLKNTFLKSVSMQLEEHIYNAPMS